jgi:uncharacterized membrane protein YdjX (TVP38/TMEM64 family)
METSKWWWDYISRKFLVLVVGTLLLWFGKIAGDIWLYLALAFMGTNIVQKYLETKEKDK